MRALALVLALAWGAAAPAADITAARFAEPTGRYDHAILGDALEWGALVLTLADGQVVRLRLPETRVFEDLAPRLIAGNDGQVLAMVVETDLERGARLALYDAGGVVAATPFIGRTHRWLAPVGAADLDGDGRVEVAYIDRPHLARTLRIWRLTPRGLVEVASAGGLTNHRIGWDFIPGGIRDCGAGAGKETGPEIIVASGDWRQVMAVRLRKGRLHLRALGPAGGPASLDRALACDG